MRNCERRIFESKALAAHKGWHTKKNEKRTKPKSLTNEKWEGVSASKPIFIKITRLKRNPKSKISKEDCRCVGCNKQCQSIQGLRAHQRAKECNKNKKKGRKRKQNEMQNNGNKNHNNKKRKIKKEKNVITIGNDKELKFKCKCGKEWPSRQQLRLHQTSSKDDIHKEYVTRNCKKPDIITIADSDDEDDDIQILTSVE